MFDRTNYGKDISELELHEKKVIKSDSESKISVLRVPGGLLYQKEFYMEPIGCSTSIEFVPFSDFEEVEN